jgi:hypothetical protein
VKWLLGPVGIKVAASKLKKTLLDLFGFSSHLVFEKLKKVEIYITVILPVGCETWSLALRDDHNLRVDENVVLRKIICA